MSKRRRSPEEPEQIQPEEDASNEVGELPPRGSDFLPGTELTEQPPPERELETGLHEPQQEVVPERAPERAGRVRVRARRTCLSEGMARMKDEEFTMPEADARKREDRGEVEIL